MTKIDFYLLSATGQNARDTMACKLIDKVYRLQHKVYVHTESQEEARRLDDYLWTFRPGSFIPHGIHLPGKDQPEPVIIGYQDQPPDGHDVLLNLDSEVPLFFSQFDRVAEIVEADEPARSVARDRFRFYKDRGYRLDTHELN